MCRLDGDWESSSESHNGLISCDCSKKTIRKEGPNNADNPIYYFNTDGSSLSDVDHKYNP